MEVNAPEAATKESASIGSQRRSVSEQIAEALKRHGVQYIIGQSIPSAVTLAATRNGIEQILCRSEKDAAIVGDGYARATNRIPVVTSCSGSPSVRAKQKARWICKPPSTNPDFSRRF